MGRSEEGTDGFVKNICFGLRISFAASTKYFLWKCLCMILGTAIPLGSIWLWKEILNGIVERNMEGFPILAGIYLVIKVASGLMEHVDTYVNTRYSDELDCFLDKIIMGKVSRMDLAFFDSADMEDRIAYVRDSRGVIQGLSQQVFGILFKAVDVLAALALVCAYRWWVGLVTMLLLIPYMACSRWYKEKCLQTEQELLRDERKMDYFSQAFQDSGGQFEIRLNGMVEYFIGRWKNLWRKSYDRRRREETRYNAVNGAALCLNALSGLLVVAASIADVAAGMIGIGDLRYNLGMVTRLQSQTEGLMEDMNRLLVDKARIGAVREFMDMEAVVERSGARQPSANPEIAFCHVTFRYPNTEQPVLKDCSFTIRHHEKVGLLGLNGAGKSTIIKLMFRFYDPEEGRILLDGIDIREYDVYAVRKVFGVLFQDYVTYCLPFREIVALPDFKERFNEGKLKAACDVSGVTEIIRKWEDGFDSVLGRYYADNGKDLSGGQWQLVGLARAYFKDSEFMVLDEPSAALDPISEDRIFEQLYRLSQEKSAVMISHRLSNTVLADRILVLGDGHVIEEGTHTELLKQGGVYARLFRLQADKYI